MNITETIFNESLFFLRDYINRHCIVRNTRMKGKAPGTFYTWQFYLRRGLFNATFLQHLSICFVYTIRKDIGHFNFQLAGMETASTPMLSALPILVQPYGISLNAFSIRKERKEYGLRNWIEGMPNDLPVVLIDDLSNSQASMANAYQILKNESIDCLPNTFTIVNKTYAGQEITDKYLPLHFTHSYLFTLQDFLLALRYDEQRPIEEVLQEYYAATSNDSIKL